MNNSNMWHIIVLILILIPSTLLIVGSIANWDWLYKGSYSTISFSLSRISLYLGRNTARIVGFAIGIILIIAAIKYIKIISFQ